jgi:hypothetical protein
VTSIVGVKVGSAVRIGVEVRTTVIGSGSLAGVSVGEGFPASLVGSGFWMEADNGRFRNRQPDVVTIKAKSNRNGII